MIQLKSHTLNFHFEAGTSRGVLTQKTSYFLRIEQDGRTGIGEAGPLRGLSPEFEEDCTATFQRIIDQLPELPNTIAEIPAYLENIPFAFPSLRMALEMALLDWMQEGNGQYFLNQFSTNEAPIPINGLIWMGNPTFMREQIEAKLAAGYNCLKLKIGAINFEQEIDILRDIRARYAATDLSIRVDANGAFALSEAAGKLERLAQFDLHSIEQPIRTGQWEAMHDLSAENILPIALDEELIGVENRAALLAAIKPPYIILKPSLLGGFYATRLWIEAAEAQGIAWWITSALESNIGLQAIAQFTAGFNNPLPQGLGTGQLYTNNFESGLYIQQGNIFQKSGLQRATPFD
ncbi:o-succinylbenzoate synthase [Aquirufa regiilacus]